MVASLQKRWGVVNLMSQTPQPSMRDVAKKMGISNHAAARWWTRFQQTGQVDAKARQPFKPSLAPATVAAIKEVASKAEPRSSTRIAAAVGQAEGVRLSGRSVRRCLVNAGFKYCQPKKMLKLTAKQIATRQQWCKKNKRTAWGGVMFTDSKIFLREPAAGAYSWQQKGKRSGRPVPSWSDKLHVYGGVTKFGRTKLYFVTGTSRQKSTFINPTTGKPYAGVCGKEFMGVASQLAADAKKLFMPTRFDSSWTFQMDNARCHTTAEVRAVLNECSPKVMEFWPPNSPDLSWIENVWGWMQREIVKLPQARDLETFKAQLQQVWDSISVDMLENYVAGMPRRVQECLAAAGQQIRV